ncbi:MAG: redoxin family protein [Pseudomonadota bacterium]
MRVVRALLAGVALLVSAAVSAGALLPLQPRAQAREAPAFTQRSAEGWINSSPLRWTDLRGAVVLLDFWTFACWNCYRSFPWLKALEARYADQGLRVIGIHSPEFEHERERENVERKVGEYGLTHPVMLDGDFAYWRAIGNEYWPTFYLIDRAGRIRAIYAGETHAGDARAQAIEADLRALLAEPDR